MWKFFFISPIYPICEKKVFISLILRRFAEKIGATLKSKECKKGLHSIFV